MLERSERSFGALGCLIWMVLMVLTVAVHATAAPPELVLYLDFSTRLGDTIPDISGNGLNGVATDVGVAAGPTGFGDAGDFNGSSSRILVAHSELLNAASFTVEAWVCPADLTRNRAYEILDKTGLNNPPPHYGFRFAFQGGASPVLHFYVRTADGGSNLIASAPWPYAMGTWHHVEGIWDDDTKTASVYVDGQLIDCQAYPGQIRSYDSTQMAVGRNRFGSGSSGETFYGKIDEVKIWNGVTPHPTANVLALISGGVSEEAELGSLVQGAGMTVDFRTSVPCDLSGYCLVVLTSHSIASPALAARLRDFVQQGGGVIVSGGVPLFLAGSTNLAAIQDWFGASQYVNSNGSSTIAVDNPLGSSLPTGTVIFEDLTNPCGYGASVAGLSVGSVPIAYWENGCARLVTVFSHEYGAGRVYYSQTIYQHDTFGRPEMLTLTSAAMRWAAGDCAKLYVGLDLKPGSCPNPLNVHAVDATDGIIDEYDYSIIGDDPLDHKSSGNHSKTVVPVAILGTADFDVMEIDRSSIRLNGVAPARFGFEDVSTPVPADALECECNEFGPDGFTDLTLKFDKAEVIASLPSLDDGEFVRVTFTGTMLDGTPIEGADCVRIINKGAKGVAVVIQPEVGDAYPNPFNPSTSFAIDFPQAANYTVTIHNIIGRTVRTYSGYADPGTVTITWDGRDGYGNTVGSGIYFYRVQAGEFTDTKRMLLLK